MEAKKCPYNNTGHGRRLNVIKTNKQTKTVNSLPLDANTCTLLKAAQQDKAAVMINSKKIS